MDQRAVLRLIRWKDFVAKIAVFGDIFYGLKTLCRVDHSVSAFVSVCVSQVRSEFDGRILLPKEPFWVTFSMASIPRTHIAAARSCRSVCAKLTLTNHFLNCSSDGNLGSGPHGGLLVLWLNFYLGKLPKHIFRHPFTKFPVAGKQPAPLIQRRGYLRRHRP